MDSSILSSTDLFLGRALGDISVASFQQEQGKRLIDALQPAAGSRAIIFDGFIPHPRPSPADLRPAPAALGSTSRVQREPEERSVEKKAHPAGVNAVVVDPHEGRLSVPLSLQPC